MVITFSILLFAASLGSLDIALYGKVGQPKGQCVEGSGNPAGCDAATHVYSACTKPTAVSATRPRQGWLGWHQSTHTCYGRSRKVGGCSAPRSLSQLCSLDASGHFAINDRSSSSHAVSGRCMRQNSTCRTTARPCGRELSVIWLKTTKNLLNGDPPF